ncbi:zinc-finger [Saccharopolyspora antimicrobica]|uniref:Zinc finger protein n=1 Tax=Saccharopolyspora antimicrobica TaxID=455193 RepID=A0A1I4VAY0_9PSEU|nr:zinc finger protein [Saccharopolyspora antimicrobica]RKT86195.1 zinc finger protein [Saccharopolyspora antimicrobica]SFM98160.1 zinc-finger [Saccharopolyspora antimicrobica]
MYRPHPFSWVPGEGERHATTEERPPGGWPKGVEVPVLCGKQVEPVSSVEAWLWTTCTSCNVEAHEVAGVPLAGAR